MKKYYIRNGNGGDILDIIYCENDAEAFREAQIRNALDKRAFWKVYTERGDRIFGVRQMNES